MATSRKRKPEQPEQSESSEPPGFVVNDCQKIAFGFGQFVPEPHDAYTLSHSTAGVTSTRNACLILNVKYDGRRYVADYTYLNNRPNSGYLDKYNVEKTVEKLIKFNLISPESRTEHMFFVSLDVPTSKIKQTASWHQDSLNIAIIHNNIAGYDKDNRPVTWMKWLETEGITYHKPSWLRSVGSCILGKPCREIRKSDYVLIEYIDYGVSTTVQIDVNADVVGLASNKLARFKTSPGSVILVENTGRHHTAPYICADEYTTVDRSAGDGLVQQIINEDINQKEGRTLYRTQLTKIETSQYRDILTLLNSVSNRVYIDNLPPFGEIQMDEYCNCNRKALGEFGGKIHKRRTNKTKRKHNGKRQKMTKNPRQRNH